MLQVQGEGEVPDHGGQAGDLFLRIRVKQDPHFQREGQTIFSTMYVPISTLALGGKIQVETVDGAETHTLSSGTGSGEELVLQGKGVPGRSGRRGDHVVRIEADIPDKLTKEQKQLLEQLREKGL
ncbi:MAG: DnaJ C-terminal domain-containing protein [Patescibacteria group bacterium]